MIQARMRNYLAFAVLMIATALGIHSPWGLLFLYWTVINFYTGSAFLLSEIARDEDPILYWLIQIAWVSFGLLLILSDFLPGWS